MSRRGQAQQFSIRKKRQGVRSMVMGKICLPSTHCLAFVLWLVAACGNSQAQAPKTTTSKTRASHEAVSCTKDAQCPSGQRCGFTFGCESKGKCIVPSGKPSCIDHRPGWPLRLRWSPCRNSLCGWLTERIHIRSRKCGRAVSATLHRGGRVRIWL